MPTSKDSLDYFLECLSLVPEVHAKAIFGEYGIYSWDRMFGLACDDTLFLKTSPETIHLFEDQKTKAYPGSKNTAPVNPDWLENPEELASIVRIILSHIPPPKLKKQRT